MSAERLECGPLLGVFRLLAGLGGRERAGIVLGLPAGSGASARCMMLIMVSNIAGSPDRFEMDPWGVVVAHKAGWNLGLEPVAVFHTHPCGAPRPSPLDLRGMRLWPLAWVIASPGGVEAWILRGGRPARVALF